MMNPQYGPPPSSQYSNSGLSSHTSAYNPLQPQNVYNGLDSNSNPGLIQSNQKQTEGYGSFSYYNQNGPALSNQTVPSSEILRNQYQPKSQSRPGQTTYQLCQQVNNMTLSQGHTYSPNYGNLMAPPPVNTSGSLPNIPPVSSAFQSLSGPSLSSAPTHGQPNKDVALHPPQSQHSTFNQGINFSHNQTSLPSTSQFVSSPYSLQTNLTSSSVINSQPISSNIGTNVTAFSQKPPPVPYNNSINKNQSNLGSFSQSPALRPLENNLQQYPVSVSQSLGQYPSMSEVSSMQPPYPPVSSQFQHSLSSPSNATPDNYQAQYNQQGIGSPPMSGIPPSGRIVSPVAQSPQPPQLQRRLDPDQMPSPIQVVEDDKKNRSGEFCTSTRGQVPPLVTTDFTVQDGGICSPRFMRSTIYNVPCTSDLLKQTSVPFAITISPFAELNEGEVSPPISDLGDMGPVRCNRCKAYMCPFMQFIDGGRRFQCVFCKSATEVPEEYFAYLDHMGDRTDKYQRPELCLGSYEFIATKDYCKNGQFPNPPAFIFMIDVSYNSIRNGMVKLLCENMKKILVNLPKENGAKKSSVKVGFVTYSNVVHFYNVKGNLAQPQMLVVSDVSDMFMPLLDGFLVNIEEAESVIESLMEQIPLIFTDSRETETILGPVIQAGVEALKAADCSGKLLIFHSTLPIAEAPGKLKNRDDRKLLGSEKEKTILTPQTTFYNNLGQDCVTAGCCVDLFLFPNAFIDIATLGQICRLTGGQLYKYSYFQADIDGHRFLEDLRRSVEKCVAFDAIMRVRTSTGIRPTEFYGNYFMSNTTDVELASVDCNKAITTYIKYDDKLVEEEGAYFQTAILYTSCSGQRRLRLHNLALNTCSQMADLYRSCELDTIMNTFAKEGIRLITEQNPKMVKDNFITRSAQILACYRKNCANPSSAGQLILPECMKLLPLYVNCLIKCDALAGGPEMSTDDRSFIMLALNSMDVNASAGYLYPRLLPLHDVDVDSEELPVALRCSIEKIKDNGAYLLENGIYLFLWIGHSVNPEWIQDVFGVQAAARIDIDKTQLLELNTPLSKRIRSIVERVRSERQRYMRLIIVRQGDKLEILFRQFLVEDRSCDGSASYVDFLCHLHKEIRSLLT